MRYSISIDIDIKRQLVNTLLWAFFAAGCTVEPFQLGQEFRKSNGGGSGGQVGDGGVIDGEGVADGETGDGAARDSEGNMDGSDGSVDAGPCTPRRELCDGLDNDCDGLVDEDFDTKKDPRNCGACGKKCDRTGTLGTCVEETCRYECKPGFIDLDNDLGTGCEYACAPTAGGVEVCDDADNNCDGKTDEGFDLKSDVNNCGKCGNACLAVHGTPTCNTGACVYQCDAGYADILATVPGCEYTCPQTPPADEVCDTVDNDCDGEIDESVPGAGASCTTAELEQYGDVGQCAFGQVKCVAGIMQCLGYVGPTLEVCDNVDNDCDDQTDEGFDKLTSIQYCGDCSGCRLPHAVAECVAGACQIKACLPGFVSLDTTIANGCEYECTPSGSEMCDGLDNDCDGLTDSADPDLTLPSNFCRTLGACTGVAPTCAANTCDSKVKWRCVYPAQTERDNCDLVFEERICDGVDGDCDGLTDESFSTKGAACADDGVGACQSTGAMQCNGPGDGLTCIYDNPGISPSAEACNGIDDDCDGQTDNNAAEDLAEVQTATLHYWIYRYEAARPDAKADNSGLMQHRSCSKKGVIPWQDATWDEASQACTNANMRLCTEQEWQAACAGASLYAYPYGNAYDAYACNGKDHDPDCDAPDQDSIQPTGTSYGCPTKPTQSRCVSEYAVVDLSGNLHEWTSTQVSASPAAYRVRGGSYKTIEDGLTCQFDFITFEPSVHLETLGFRCCMTWVP